MRRGSSAWRRTPRRRGAVLATVFVVTVVALAASVTGIAATNSSSASGTLVIDNSFVIRTADPQREFDPTGDRRSCPLRHAAQVQGRGHVARSPARHLVQGLERRQAVHVHLRNGIVFSDGTPLTSKDVVFSFQRLVNLKGNPSFLLANVTTDAERVDGGAPLEDAEPCDPALLANTSLGIVNSKVVRARRHRRCGADKEDKAEKYLDGTSAGSGPYVLKQFSTNQQIVLDANPRSGARRRSSDRRPSQRDRSDSALERPARYERDRARSLAGAGEDAEEEQAFRSRSTPPRTCSTST